MVRPLDPAPGFIALKHDDTLKQLGITLDIGRVKNINKNPVAEKAIAVIEEELLRQVPNNGPVTNLSLSIAIARLNSRLRRHGISAHELWTQRNQFTHDQLPISDRNIIINQHKQRQKNHPYSERSKNWKKNATNPPNINVGDLVYLHSDRDKTHTRSRYLVVSIDSPWCYIKTFAGNQLRASSYKVKLCECHLVPNQVPEFPPIHTHDSDSDDDDATNSPPPQPTTIPPMLTLPASSNNPPLPQDIHPRENSPSSVTRDTNITTRTQRNRRPPKYFEY